MNDSIRLKIEAAIRLSSTPEPSREVVEWVRKETIEELARRTVQHAG